MTKPKQYPKGITSWLEIEYRFQGGSSLKLWGSADLIDVSQTIIKTLSPTGINFLSLTFTITPFIRSSCFWYIDNTTPRDQSRSISFNGIHSWTPIKNKSLSGKNRKDSVFFNYILCLAASISHDTNECPTYAGLRRALLEKELPEGYLSWGNKLSSLNATRNMRDLLTLARLAWLPRDLRKSEIVEVFPPYGSKKELALIIPFLLSYEDNSSMEKLQRHHPVIRMFTQLPQGYKEPPKRRRGRPLGSKSKGIT